MGELSRWTVTVSRETDEALREFLATRGAGKGELSKFIEQAVNTELLRATIREIQDQNASLPGDEVQALIDNACQESRSRFWRERAWWSD